MNGDPSSLAGRHDLFAKLKASLGELLGPSLIKLVLFGSRARGDWDRASDADVAVIVTGLTREQRDAIFQKVAELELECLAPVSLVILSEEQFNKLRSRERRLALDIEREGVPL